MRKKKVTQTTEIPVILDNTEPKVQTNKELQASMERYRVFGRSLFGDDFEVGAVRPVKDNTTKGTV